MCLVVQAFGSCFQGAPSPGLPNFAGDLPSGARARIWIDARGRLQRARHGKKLILLGRTVQILQEFPEASHAKIVEGDFLGWPFSITDHMYHI